MAAELLALKVGLQCLVEQDCFRVLIETDSSEVKNLLHNFEDLVHPFWELILDCKYPNRILWSCPIAWVPHQCNICADCLAKAWACTNYCIVFYVFDVCLPSMEWFRLCY